MRVFAGILVLLMAVLLQSCYRCEHGGYTHDCGCMEESEVVESEVENKGVVLWRIDSAPIKNGRLIYNAAEKIEDPAPCIPQWTRSDSTMTDNEGRYNFGYNRYRNGVYRFKVRVNDTIYYEYRIQTEIDSTGFCTMYMSPYSG